MKKISILFFVSVFSMLLFTSYSFASWFTLYEEDFSSDPFTSEGWETNKPSRYYWDSSKQSLYTDNYTNSGDYATKTIDYNGESFRLQFDIKPTYQNSGTLPGGLNGYGDIDFGLFGPTRRSHSVFGSSIERVFGFIGGYPSGNQMALEGASATGNQIGLPTSGNYSMQLDKWHHFDIQYNDSSENINFSVKREGESDPLFSESANVNGGFSGNLDYLGVSMNGYWVYSNRREIAYVDNVKIEVETPGITPPQANPPEDREGPQYLYYDDAHVKNLSSYATSDRDPLDSSKPTILITHGLSGFTGDVVFDPDTWVIPMAEDIKTRLDEKVDNYNIGFWDWRKEASWIVYPNQNLFSVILNPGTEWDTVLNTAEDQSGKLAEFLRVNNITNDLHFIGHSAGGTLIDRTANNLENNQIQVEQLTYLDTPGFLDATEVNWADNYQSSILGVKNINGAYNYILSTRTHGYSIEYYDLTIQDDSYQNGFYWSKDGGYTNEDERQALRGKTEYQDSAVSEPEPLPLIFDVLLKDEFNEVGPWFRSGNVSLIDGSAVLIEASPAYLFEDILIPVDVNYFGFDFKFAELGDGDYLTVNFNKDLLFWFEGTHFYGDDFWRAGPLNISPYSGQYGTLTFGLNSIGNSNAELWIDNLQFYNISPVPEPSTLFLLGIGMAGILFRKKFLRF